MNQKDFKHLKIGKMVKVVSEFTDYDEVVHPVGEEWTYMGYGFLPYDDGLTLHTDKLIIRIRWVDQCQGPIIDNLSHYLVVV